MLLEWLVLAKFIVVVLITQSYWSGVLRAVHFGGKPN